jgi:hypothetical protein
VNRALAADLAAELAAGSWRPSPTPPADPLARQLQVLDELDAARSEGWRAGDLPPTSTVHHRSRPASRPESP